MTQKASVDDRDKYITPPRSTRASSSEYVSANNKSDVNSSKPCMPSPSPDLKRKRYVNETLYEYVLKSPKLKDTPEDLKRDRSSHELYLDSHDAPEVVRNIVQAAMPSNPDTAVSRARSHSTSAVEHEQTSIKEDPEESDAPHVSEPRATDQVDTGGNSSASQQTEDCAAGSTMPSSESSIMSNNKTTNLTGVKRHAIHCGSSECEQCANMSRRFAVWDFDDIKNTNIYTEQYSTFIQTYDGSKNILAMIVDQELMQDIQDSVAAGKRYRILKTEVEAAVQRLDNENRDTRQTYFLAKMDYENLKRKLTRHGRKPAPPEKLKLRELSAIYRKAQANRQNYENTRLELREHAKRVENEWVAAMRQVDYQHQCLLGDAGVIPREAVDHWQDKDYEFADDAVPETFRSGAGSSDYHIEEQETDPVSNQEDSATLRKKALRARHEFYTEKLDSCKYEVHMASIKHDEHREIYKELFHKYANENPGIPLKELKQSFGPIFVQQWQQRIQALKTAEEALEAAQREFDEELNGCPIEESKREMEDSELRAVEKEMDKYYIAHLDRSVIEQWLAAIVPSSDPAAPSIEESTKLWELPRLVLSKSSASVAEDSHHASESALSPDPAAKLALGCGDQDDSPHVDTAFLDSCSVYDDNADYRQAIDKFARELRGGYY